MEIIIIICWKEWKNKTSINNLFIKRARWFGFFFFFPYCINILPTLFLGMTRPCEIQG